MSDNRHIAALIFDLGNVISRSLFELTGPLEAGLGLPAGTITWGGPFRPAADPDWIEIQEGRLSEYQYWADRAAEIGTLLGEDWTGTELYGRAIDILGRDWVRPEFLELLCDAKAAGLRVGILTNGLELLVGRAWLGTIPELEMLSAVIDATETKIPKPDPRSYKLATDALEVAPGETLFVDDLPKNVRGAEAAGLLGFWFDMRRPAEMYADIRRIAGLPS